MPVLTLYCPSESQVVASADVPAGTAITKEVLRSGLDAAPDFMDHQHSGRPLRCPRCLSLLCVGGEGDSPAEIRAADYRPLLGKFRVG